jgi:hypothetical protein
MRHPGSVIVLAIAVIAAGCSTTTPTPELATAPTFEFEPPSRTAIDTLSVSFCLVRPQFP